MKGVTHKDIADIWAQVAKHRREKGDKPGAGRAWDAAFLYDELHEQDVAHARRPLYR